MITAGTVFAALALIVIAVVAVGDPWLTRRGRTRPVPLIHHGDGMGTSYELTLGKLRELDFDYETGKVQDSDYRVSRQALLVKAASSLQEQEALSSALERKIMDIRQDRTLAPICPGCGHALSSGDRFCPACGQPVSVKCPGCGESVQETDAYCSHCGRHLSA